LLSKDENIQKSGIVEAIWWKEENKASISAFTKAGFIDKGLQDFKGLKAIEMVWSQE